jgi:hypothetical protein
MRRLSITRVPRDTKSGKARAMRDNPPRGRIPSGFCCGVGWNSGNRRKQPEVKVCAREFDQRVSDYLAFRLRDFPILVASPPFPPTLAPHLLDQVKLEKNCLANGTCSHPHSLSPFIAASSQALFRLAPREECCERLLRLIGPHALREYFVLKLHRLLQLLA